MSDETHGIGTDSEYTGTESAREIKVKTKTAARMVGLKKCASRYVAWIRKTFALKSMTEIKIPEGFGNEVLLASVCVVAKMTYYAKVRWAIIASNVSFITQRIPLRFSQNILGLLAPWVVAPCADSWISCTNFQINAAGPAPCRSASASLLESLTLVVEHFL
jgi:hypothetical protein